MDCVPLAIPEVFRIEPKVYGDDRGHLFEAFSSPKLANWGVTFSCKQINRSYSKKGVIRGLHYQLGKVQAKIVSVIVGSILDVAVDLRPWSPTFMKWLALELTAQNNSQLFIPEGFAHGFATLEDSEMIYFLSQPYDAKQDRGVRWNDPQLAIPWPVASPILSARDRALPLLSEIAQADLPALPR